MQKVFVNQLKRMFLGFWIFSKYKLLHLDIKSIAVNSINIYQGL